MGLREKTVQMLERYPHKLNMSATQSRHGETGCLAWFIMRASGATLREAYLRTEPKWLEPQLGYVVGYARQVWAAEYGEAAALALPFYGQAWPGKNLAQIHAADVILYLEGLQLPVKPS